MNNMITGVYKYSDSKRQTAWWRGYVKRYDKNIVRIKTSPQVRATRKEALQDAKRLLVT